MLGLSVYQDGPSSLESKSNAVLAQISFLDSRPDAIHAAQFPTNRRSIVESVILESEEEEVRSFGESFDLDAATATGISSFIIRNSELFAIRQSVETSHFSGLGLPLSGRSRHILYQIFRI